VSTSRSVSALHHSRTGGRPKASCRIWSGF